MSEQELLELYGGMSSESLNTVPWEWTEGL